jgi:hypothetical protein
VHVCACACGGRGEGGDTLAAHQVRGHALRLQSLQDLLAVLNQPLLRKRIRLGLGVICARSPAEHSCTCEARHNTTRAWLPQWSRRNTRARVRRATTPQGRGCHVVPAQHAGHLSARAPVRAGVGGGGGNPLRAATHPASVQPSAAAQTARQCCRGSRS